MMQHKHWMALGLIAIAAPAAAHHSFAMFDMQKDVTVVGTVTEFRWTNPHSFMHLLVPDAQGGSTNWAFEMTSPNTLVHGGWRRSSLKPGDKVTVTYHPLLNGKLGGALVRVKLPDGTVLENK
jgi:hypothetical protein